MLVSDFFNLFLIELRLSENFFDVYMENNKSIILFFLIIYIILKTKRSCTWCSDYWADPNRTTTQSNS